MWEPRWKRSPRFGCLAEGSLGLLTFRDASAASLGQNSGREGPQTEAVPLRGSGQALAAFPGLWAVGFAGAA